MERGIIQADDRHTARRIKTAMQGSIIRALVELITNSDDSYTRLEDMNLSQNKGVIEILYEKEGHRGVFAVRDDAEGMSIEEVRNSFKKYGAATSGMKMGKRVRGYFGQGAKDSLASMIDGKICTFKGDSFTECRLFIEDGRPMYEIDDPITVTKLLRETHKIDGNGTIAYFKADRQSTGSSVPRFDTVHQELSNNFLLRKIMTNPRRKVILKDNNNRSAPRRLRYLMPEGKEILQENFTVSYNTYGDFQVHISLWRSNKELTQTGDDRDGGLLIVDDEDVVLGISLFKYDNEALASHFFGELRIGSFRKLLINEEPVLSEERDGLIPRHPFCQKLITEIEKRIDIKIKEERLRKQKEEQIKIDNEEAGRYKKAFTILNEIAEVEAPAVKNLGPGTMGPVEPPPNGFHLFPSSAQITVSKRYAFELRLDTKVIRPGSVINISCTNTRIYVLTPEIKISPEDGLGILRKYITVEGREPEVNGVLQAIVGNNLAQSDVYVIPEKELLLSEGMVFQPESLTIRPNQSRKVHLLVYIKMIEGGSTIRITTDNNSIHLSKEEVVVIEADAIRNVIKRELEIWGEGAGQDAFITAEYGDYRAFLEVRVRSKEERKDRTPKGMFIEPEFNDDPEPIQRTSYSSEAGKVIIYVKFPSTRHYLGDDCQYRKTLYAQVLIADLVAERCFHEIAAKKVELSGAILRPEAIPDRIQRDAYELSRKYGQRLHEALVDQMLIEEAKANSKEKIEK